MKYTLREMYSGVQVLSSDRGCSLLAFGWGLVPRVEGLGVGVEGLGVGIQGSGFRV